MTREEVCLEENREGFGFGFGFETGVDVELERVEH